MTKRQQRVTRPAARPPVLLLAAAGALLLVIVGVFIIANQPGVSPATAGARVAVEPETIDFGKVQVEQPLTARFVVRNEGDETLQILGQPQVRLVEGC